MGRTFSSTWILKKAKMEFGNIFTFRKTCMTLGVGAGFAAAFGAPVGGLLFACEEILALDRTRQWLAFIASVVAYWITIWKTGSTNGIFNVHTKAWNSEEVGFVLVLGVL